MSTGGSQHAWVRSCISIGACSLCAASVNRRSKKKISVTPTKIVSFTNDMNDFQRHLRTPVCKDQIWPFLKIVSTIVIPSNGNVNGGSECIIYTQIFSVQVSSSHVSSRTCVQSESEEVGNISSSKVVGVTVFDKIYTCRCSGPHNINCVIASSRNYWHHPLWFDYVVFLVVLVLYEPPMKKVLVVKKKSFLYLT